MVSGWLREPGDLGDSGRETVVLGDFEVTRGWIWGPRVTRKSGFPELLGTPGSLGHAELAFTGVTRNIRNPEFRLNQGTRGDYENPLLQENTGKRSDSGNPDLRVNPGNRKSGCLRNPVVPSSTWIREPGKVGDIGNPLFRFPAVTGNSGLPESPWTPCYRSHPVHKETGVPGFSGKPKFRVSPRSSGWLRETEVDSGKTDFRVTLAARISGQLWKPGIPSDQRNPEFRVTPRTRSSWWFWEPVFPCDSYPESPGTPGFWKQFRLTTGTWSSWFPTPGTRSSLWLFEHGVLSGSENRSFGLLRECGFPAGSENTDFRVTPRTRFRVTQQSRLNPGIRSSGCLRFPGVNSEFRIPVVMRNSLLPSWWWTEKLSETCRVLFQI